MAFTGIKIVEERILMFLTIVLAGTGKRGRFTIQVWIVTVRKTKFDMRWGIHFGKQGSIVVNTHGKAITQHPIHRYKAESTGKGK
jgi:hypothetical protein